MVFTACSAGSPVTDPEMDHRSNFGDGPHSIKERKRLDAAAWRKDDAPGSRDLGRPQDTAAVTRRPSASRELLSWTPDRIERRPAATASRPAVVTIANAPLIEARQLGI
jgi:hypothetical protein